MVMIATINTAICFVQLRFLMAKIVIIAIVMKATQREGTRVIINIIIIFVTRLGANIFLAVMSVIATSFEPFL